MNVNTRTQNMRFRKKNSLFAGSDDGAGPTPFISLACIHNAINIVDWYAYVLLHYPRERSDGCFKVSVRSFWDEHDLNAADGEARYRRLAARVMFTACRLER